MNTNTNTTTKKATRPAGFTKFDWDSKTFRVFDGLVKLCNQQVDVKTFVNHPIVKELMERCCGSKTPEDRYPLFVSLLISSCTYGTVGGVKVLKIKSISTVRQWFNGGWEEKMSRPVVYKEPKEPVKKESKKASPKEKKQVKKFTNASVTNWVKTLSDDQMDILRIAMANRDMDLDAVAC